MRALVAHWDDDDAYFSEARKSIEAFEKMFEADREAKPSALDPAWHPPTADDRSRG